MKSLLFTILVVCFNIVLFSQSVLSVAGISNPEAHSYDISSNNFKNNITIPFKSYSIIKVKLPDGINLPVLTIADISVIGRKLPKDLEIIFYFGEDRDNGVIFPMYELTQNVIESNKLFLNGRLESDIVIRAKEQSNILNIEIKSRNINSKCLISFRIEEFLEFENIVDRLHDEFVTDVHGLCEEPMNLYFIIDGSESMDKHNDITRFKINSLKSDLSPKIHQDSRFFIVSNGKIIKYSDKLLEEVLQTTKKKSGTNYIEHINNLKLELPHDTTNLMMIIHDGWVNKSLDKKSNYSVAQSELISKISDNTKINKDYILLIPIGIVNDAYQTFIDSKSTVSPFSVLNGTLCNNNSIQEKINIKIYPNPSLDYFYLDLQRPITKPLDCTISDYFGRVIIKITLEDEITYINSDRLSPGVFFVNIRKGDSVYSSKFIVQ